MKSLDCFYEKYLCPFMETMIGFGELIFEGLLVLVFMVTAPFWIIPYVIIKQKKGGE